MAVRILVVEATRTGRWACRCQRTAPVAASMTTAVRASTRGAVGADAHRERTATRCAASTLAREASVGADAAAGVAVHPTTRPSARTREGNHRWRERTPVGCTNQWKECNTLDPDAGPRGERPRTAA